MNEKKVKRGDTVELQISALAFEGGGIGEIDGLKIFVEGAFPGDTVSAYVFKSKKNYAEARLIEILKPSEDRITPRCEYVGTCRGCQMQEIPYDKQVDIKKSHIEDCLSRIGGFKDIKVSEIIPSKDNFFYRNKMEFSFGYDADKNFTLGMHAPNRKFDILDLKRCYLESEFSIAIVALVRKFSKDHGFIPFNFGNGEGDFRSLYIREGKRTGEVMVNIVVSDNVSQKTIDDISLLASQLSNLKSVAEGEEDKKIVSVYMTKVISKKGVPRSDRSYLLYGKASISEKMVIDDQTLNFDIYPSSFFQVNTFQAEELYRIVRDFAMEKSQGVVFDLFCGTGTIGLFLSKHVHQVIGVELVEDAVKAARENALKNGIFNADFYLGDVFKKLSEIRERPSLVVVDPPRAGLSEKSILKLNEFSPSQIIYVSCNPATLARDLKIFSEFGYRIKKIKAVDMFPHTYHIETVVLIEKDF